MGLGLGLLSVSSPVRPRLMCFGLRSSGLCGWLGLAPPPPRPFWRGAEAAMRRCTWLEPVVRVGERVGVRVKVRVRARVGRVQGEG